MCVSDDIAHLYGACASHVSDTFGHWSPDTRHQNDNSADKMLTEKAIMNYLNCSMILQTITKKNILSSFSHYYFICDHHKKHPSNIYKYQCVSLKWPAVCIKPCPNKHNTPNTQRFVHCPDDPTTAPSSFSRRRERVCVCCFMPFLGKVSCACDVISGRAQRLSTAQRATNLASLPYYLELCTASAWPAGFIGFLGKCATKNGGLGKSIWLHVCQCQLKCNNFGDFALRWNFINIFIHLYVNYFPTWCRLFVSWFLCCNKSCKKKHEMCTPVILIRAFDEPTRPTQSCRHPRLTSRSKKSANKLHSMCYLND